MKYVTRNGRRLFQFSHFLKIPAIEHFVTTRRGGASTGVYNSLNLSLTVGDQADRVLKNRRRLGRAAGLSLRDFILGRQVHRGNVKVVRVADAGRGSTDHKKSIPNIDALVTKQPGVGLLTLSADCPLILCVDPARKVVANIHASWRGLSKNIIRKTITRMRREFGCRSKDIRAGVAPAIGVCCYQVQDDFIRTLKRAIPGAGQYLVKRGRKKYFDLRGLIRRLLKRSGLKNKNIEVSRLCSCCHPELFYSYRRDGARTGRIGALIYLKPQKIAAIDIGTNSLKLLIAQVDPGGKIKTLKEIVRTTRLGRRQKQTGRLSGSGMRLSLKVLKEFVRLVRRFQVEQIQAVATCALREAGNRKVFLRAVRRATGLRVKVLTARSEAKLSFRGAVAGVRAGINRLVIDIGGGSTELVWGRARAIGYRSLPLGAVKLTEQFVHQEPITDQSYRDLVAFIKKKLTRVYRQKNMVTVGLGGTVTTLVAMMLRLKRPDPIKTHQYVLRLAELKKIVRRLRRADLATSKKMRGCPADRADIILAGAVVLLCLMRSLKINRVITSTRGLRYGLIES